MAKLPDGVREHQLGRAARDAGSSELARVISEEQMFEVVVLGRRVRRRNPRHQHDERNHIRPSYGRDDHLA
jgi:hypothetical protein